MNITINNTAAKSELTLAAILAFEQRTNITLPQRLKECLVNDELYSLVGKGFFEYDNEFLRHHVSAQIISWWIPVTNQQSKFKLPIIKGRRLNQLIKTVDFNRLMNSITEFCLTDWQPGLIEECMPFAVTKNGSLICFDVTKDNYGKIYRYGYLGIREYPIYNNEGEIEDCDQEDIYGFSLIADSFTDFVENLVEPELAKLAPQLSNAFNIKDSKDLLGSGTKTLECLNKIANTIYKAKQEITYQSILAHEQFKKDYQQKIEEVDTLTATLDDYRQTISNLLESMTILESLETSYQQQICLLKQELRDHDHQLKQIKTSPLKKLQFLFNL